MKDEETPFTIIAQLVADMLNIASNVLPLTVIIYLPDDRTISITINKTEKENA